MMKLLLRRAFTLIELLVVIAIVALLSVLLFAGIGSSQQVAEAESTKSLLSIVESLIQNYEAEYGTYPLQANWKPSGFTHGRFWNAPLLADRTTDTNNLAYTLCHPNPVYPITKAEKDAAKWRLGYAGNGGIDKVPQENLNPDVDYTTAVPPIAIYDSYGDAGELGKPLLYIFDPYGEFSKIQSNLPVWIRAGRIDAEAQAETDGVEPESFSAFTHAYRGFDKSFELWSIGPDGLFDERLHDRTLIENQDNITVSKYK